MKIFIAYFATREDCVSAHEDAQVLGGKRMDSERLFLVFTGTEEELVQQIQCFTDNGATNVQEIL